MSITSKLTEARDKSVAFFNKHKQTIINTALIGATIGTVISLRALNEQQQITLDALDTNTETLGSLIDAVYEDDPDAPETIVISESTPSS